MDSSDDERRRYIEIIENLRTKFKGKPIQYLWSQGGDQYAFEEKFALGSGFPAVMAINEGKKVFSIMRASYTEKNTIAFLNDLLGGKESSFQFKFDVEVRKAKKWVDPENLGKDDDDDDNNNNDDHIQIKDDL